MRVIMSKKGFDGAYGGFASPLLPDEKLVSLPIPALPRTPSEDHRIKYSDLSYGRNRKIVDLLAEMRQPEIKVRPGNKKSKIPREKEDEWRLPRKASAHLDPDLRQDSYPREGGWRGLLGMNDHYPTEIEHLTEGEGLRSGDLFLFFGWFEKYTYNSKRKLENVENWKDYRTGRHVIFGYLQIDTVLKLSKLKKDDARIEKWMDYHPHIGENRKFVGNTPYFNTNALYIARKNFENTQKPGFGLFRYDGNSAKHLTLTKKGCTRTQWVLPSAFYKPKLVQISRCPKGWKKWNNGKGFFQLTRGFGQEYLIKAKDGSRSAIEIEKWANSLITNFG